MDENNNRKVHSYTSKGPRGKRDFSKRGHGKPGFSGGRGAGHGKDFKDGKREFRRKLEPGVEFIDRKLGVGRYWKGSPSSEETGGRSTAP